VSLSLLNFVQASIMSCGLLVGSAIVANDVVKGRISPSAFIVFNSYLAQLYGPLGWLGGLYRQLNQLMVDSEKLLKLLSEEVEVKDPEGATELVVSDGEIVFEDVHFSYDGRRPALSGVSFTVPKGHKVGLIGETGSGKSTILRLLYRFYNLQSGAIRCGAASKSLALLSPSDASRPWRPPQNRRPRHLSGHPAIAPTQHWCRPAGHSSAKRVDRVRRIGWALSSLRFAAY
jgi:ABC-type transport system involved in Fe-S cluster assembly fused permease/ATPase subunit